MISVVTAVNVTKSYRLGKIGVPALTDVSITINPGEFVALSGPSGSGKTTLLNLIGCIDRPDSGNLFIDTLEVTQCGEGQRTRLRREKLGYVFQTFNLIPVLSAFENVEFPLML